MLLGEAVFRSHSLALPSGRIERPKRRDALFDVMAGRLYDDANGNHLAQLLARDEFPTVRHGADFGLFFGFAAEAVGEELVEERLLQFRGERDEPLLLLQRPL